MPFSVTRNPLSLLPQAIEIIESGHAVAMATLINVEGGSPYPQGSQMLIIDTGEYIGQLTGGCAEKAIVDQALKGLSSSINTVHRYGSGSPYFDIQLPCGSGVDVLIDVQSSLHDYQRIMAALNQRKGVVEQILSSGKRAYSKWHVPQPRLVIMGQGAILIQTCQFALMAGFDVLPVINDDQSMQALKSLAFDPTKIEQSASLEDLYDQFTGVVSVFHEHDNELSLLERALNTEVFYIGALGSRKTHDNRLNQLRQLGLLQGQLSRIHGPVGVDIRSTTPAQIAVSIVAEAIDCLNKRIASVLESI